MRKSIARDAGVFTYSLSTATVPQEYIVLTLAVTKYSVRYTECQNLRIPILTDGLYFPNFPSHYSSSYSSSSSNDDECIEYGTLLTGSPGSGDALDESLARME